MNMGLQVPVWDPAFSYFSYIPGREIVGSYSNSIFNFLGNCHTVFHSGCMILHSQLCTSVLVSPHPYQNCFDSCHSYGYEVFLSFFIQKSLYELTFLCKMEIWYIYMKQYIKISTGKDFNN